MIQFKQFVTVISLMLVICLGSNSCGKNSKKNTNHAESEYNPAVESFSSGTIGRKECVNITFTETVPSSLKFDQFIKISPSIKGTWTRSPHNSRLLTFCPQPRFEREVLYTVKMDINKLFSLTTKSNDFFFSFKTLPPAAVAEFISLDVEPKGTYEIKGQVLTADFEEPRQVQEMSKWGGITEELSKEIKWTHSDNGKEHYFTVSNIPVAETEGTLTLTVDDSKGGYDKEELLSVLIPKAKDFEIHSVDYSADDEHSIEVRFSQRLDPRQEMEGLVWLEGIKSVRQIDNNKILIYPDISKVTHNDDGKAYMTLNINKALRSATGVKLKEDIQRTLIIEQGDPEVRFASSGTIIPPTSALVDLEDRQTQIIPFQAVSLRAVRVDVIRVLEKSMIQYLQGNQLSAKPNSSIARTARPIASKTIFLDEQGDQKLRKWNTYSLDVYDLIEPEPGALYFVTLSFNRSMAILPCIPQDERLTKQSAERDDEARLKYMMRRYDAGGYYSHSTAEAGYKWSERDDPCKTSYYHNTAVSKSILVTDLGVMAKASDESSMMFLVNSLSTAEPVEGANVELKNYQGQKVADGVTNSDGQAKITYNRGEAFYAVVTKDDQWTYLKINSGSELSTSTFDVSGEQVQDGVRGFLWTERGVWRPGDSIYMNFVASSEYLPENHPVTVELRSPMGQLYQRQVTTKSIGGIYSFVLTTDTESPTGVWNATVTVGGGTFDKRLRIEAVKPNRLKIDLKFPDKFISRGEPLNATLHGEWLTGAKVGGLKYTIETTFTSVRSSFDGYKGYMFDNNYQSFEPEVVKRITGTTDAKGDDIITTVLNGGEKAGGMLSANITTRLFEPAGEASVNSVTIPYSPFSAYVGIRPPAGADDRLDTDKDYTFEIATVLNSGTPAKKRDVRISAYKVSWYWWWSTGHNRLARHVSSQGLEPIQQDIVTTSSAGKVSYKLNIPKSQWGTYYITARDLISGHESAILVYMDWPNYGDRNKGETGATRLAVSLDKKTYNVGDQATVSFPSIVGSRAIISIENASQVLNTFPIECNEQNTKYSFEVTPDMQPNVYLNVTLLQPYGKVGNDLPVRLYGIIPLTATSKESILQPIITCADDVLPESEMEIRVSEKDGKPFAYTLALVDEGLLDLTQFRTPNPWAAFNAKVALGVSTWDIYNDVLGGYGGKIEQMFAIGGDDVLDSDNSAPINRFPPMVKYLGVFELKEGKESTHKVKLPAYMGRVRVMVVAISNSDANAWGSTEKSVSVRSPLMILGSAPRAVAVGDEIVVAATLIATEDAVGSVTASIKVNENVFSIIGEKKHTASLTHQGDKIVLFRVKVKDDAQIASKGGRIQLSATSKKGRTSTYAMDIPIRILSMPVSEGKSYTVDANKKWDGAIDLQGMLGTRRLMLEVSSIVPINSAQRMEYLSKYPYGCIEQITSAVFPILYLMEMVDLSELEQTESEEKIRLVLNKYKSYATPDGMMGYWPGSTNPNMWGSTYALHFMAEARSKGYTPPAGVYERLKTAVKSTAIRWKSSTRGGHSLTQAYQLYALALAEAPELGAMNRLRQSDNMTSEARWMLAAAYATAGRSDIGKMIVAKKETKETTAELQRQYRTTYGSQQREQAVQLLGASLLGIDREASELALIISKKLASKEWMSTQTSAWCMMAIGEYLVMNGKVSQLNFEWKVDGESEEVASDSKKMVWSKDWENPSSGSASIENNTSGTLHIRLVSSGISSGHGLTAAANGVKVTVRYLDNNDNPINISTLAQGVDFISEVTVENLETESLYNLMLTEPMASGWEIRPDGKVELKGVDYRDIRDDRVNSFIPQLDANKTIVVRTRLNATYGGVYLLPSIRCAAMYDGEISGHTASGSAVIE